MITRGSEWHRWEPHIHAPGTILNDQFKPDEWDSYLDMIEKASPPIRAIAITDYYTTASYEKVLLHQKSGRLSNISLIIPNIEIRLDVAAKSGFINLHLLVNPNDSNHVSEIHRFLSRLHFSAHNDRFDCTPEDLIRLGKITKPDILDDHIALAHGATQFKVNFSALRNAYNENAWAKNNILIGVAGGSGDGTSGLRQSADQTIRQEIESFAHFIFTSNPNQREFWLGLRGLSVQELQNRYSGCKPCMHGSDAHSLSDTAQPAEDRFSWIKGALSFEALQQACIDPANRAYVGPEPPKTAMPSQVISKINIKDADWASTKSIPLNPGLVAIIGARGSGKTALADMIATGCDSIGDIARRPDMDISPSFLTRALPLLSESKVNLHWEGGNTTNRYLDGRDANDAGIYARARYLSQQFVEELCSSSGASKSLIQEIERVIFEAHTDKEQDGAINFDHLREQRTYRFQQAREREAAAITVISNEIAAEFEKEALVTNLKSQLQNKKNLLADYTADLKKIVLNAAVDQACRHAELSSSTQTLTSKITGLTSQLRTLLTMQDEVTSTRATKTPEMLRQVMAKHPDSGFNDTQWQEFMLIYKGDVDKALSDQILKVNQKIANLTGTAVPGGNLNTVLIAPETDLSTLPLSILQAEMSRLEKLISADTTIRNQYSALSKRISSENKALQTLQKQLEDAQGAAERRKTLQSEREAAYGRLFTAIICTQQELISLYEPLMARLNANNGTLKKLSVRVSRTADVERWASYGEEHLLDCRKAGLFMGRGKLKEIALSELKAAWEGGTDADIQSAMTTFITKYTKDFLAHAPFSRNEQVALRKWMLEFANWIFDTSHISVHYEILYDGSDIHKLSPGTRGIVLLLLYLALDESDDRPLIIDQPEENLDPKSVNEELVPLFMEVRSKRQVIIVTHNANLVINTDADQIIVADSTPTLGGGLPTFTYTSGGLEDSYIRKQVCDILEGGDTAFKERARRLRVRIDR